MFHTYILYSEKHDRYYIGHCEVMEARLLRHNTGKVTYTRKFIPWRIVYVEKYSTKSEAFRREREIKRQKSRVYIEQLIRNVKIGSHVPIQNRDSQP